MRPQVLLATPQPTGVVQLPRIGVQHTLQSQTAALHPKRSRMLWLPDQPALPAAAAPAPWR
jgi:hypothetical protein